MNTPQIPTADQRFDLLTEIEQTPDEYIPELLKIVRSFRQHSIVKQTSTNAWNRAIDRINSTEGQEQTQAAIGKLFQDWIELDEEEEQKETLGIIESIEGVSI
ncbi:hypothetical protein [Chamaesiphon polymorphus]|uniref:Uncharacterized protein n=1 Tax=Chamaesiphon polymorphus CCALA 037 TaxID=2107692 RepID=A0A2T1GIC6_9CYAN|nr:hypothetical protein [Chamaesiphon polymorphus]PSB57395.1 hypothetical protein C7B77_08525 [Chamaesiphon polymorphus CCALA 037]